MIQRIFYHLRFLRWIVPHRTFLYLYSKGKYPSRNILMVEYYSPKNSEQYFLILNLFWEDLTFELPQNYSYNCLISSSSISETIKHQKSISIKERSVALLKRL